MSERIPAALAQFVRDRAAGCCEYCRLPQFTQEATFHIDHILPSADGGETTSHNLALACVTCSLRKGARTVGRDTNTLRLVRLFHPRHQGWDRHFRWTDRWKIEGLTATGRVTVGTLGMNRPAILAIRRMS